MSETSEKIHFVMVHGFGHGAWCWYKIRSLLEASGYKVSCIDLKGSGIDPSDPNTIFTFQDYNEPLINLLSNLPQNQKVILVGHSAGGHSLTYAMRKFVNKIRMAIYVSATMLKHGFVTPQDYEDGDLDLSVYGDVNEKIYGLGADQPTTSMIIKEEFQRKILYHLSSIEVSTTSSSQWRMH
ncbi:methylesterase 17-like [Hibiscus syriacus]|uniref:methylesterase 17-like n=1 Tax=Hibiscus syriacus TaxID=106335 RepID=UPI0019225035|nr:methylesterase 17-like [Hibiscus syriacus]